MPWGRAGIWEKSRKKAVFWMNLSLVKSTCNAIHKMLMFNSR